MSEINTELGGLDDVASQEIARLNARVQQFQQQAETQAKLQQSISELHDTCFDVVSKTERKNTRMDADADHPPVVDRCARLLVLSRLCDGG